MMRVIISGQSIRLVILHAIAPGRAVEISVHNLTAPTKKSAKNPPPPQGEVELFFIGSRLRQTDGIDVALPDPLGRTMARLRGSCGMRERVASNLFVNQACKQADARFDLGGVD